MKLAPYFFPWTKMKSKFIKGLLKTMDSKMLQEKSKENISVQMHMLSKQIIDHINMKIWV